VASSCVIDDFIRISASLVGKDPMMVFEKAEETAAKYHERMEVERKAREQAARDIVLGLGDSLDDLGDSESSDPLADVSDSLDSLLS
jgi:predicted secreted acid phosphatase